MEAPTIFIDNLEEHHTFLTELFADHPSYSFDPLSENSYVLYNLRNGKKLRFEQKTSGEEARVGLITFMCQSKEDLEDRQNRIIELGGSVTAEVKEIRPNHYSGWYKSPVGWDFGLAHWTVNDILS